MDMNDLDQAFAAGTPDQEAVLATLRTKLRRRTRRRALAATGVVAAAAVCALVVTGLGPASSPTVPIAQGPTATSTPTAGTDGCAQLSLRETFATARQGGASVVLAKGALTGRSAPGDPLHAEMRLTGVRTLSGPPIASGALVWAFSAAVPGADAGSLWAPDGGLIAIVWPRAAGDPVGPTVRVAPVVGTEVVLSAAGCWNAQGLPSRPFTGPLSAIPGSDSYRRAARTGFHAVPLAQVEQLAAG